MKRCTSTDAEALRPPKPSSQEEQDESAAQPSRGVVELEFIGSLWRVAGEKKIALPLEVETTISGLLELLDRRIGGGASTTLSPGRLMFTGLTHLVLVNGVEVSALQGAETRVRPGDRVVFIPVSHGG